MFTYLPLQLFFWELPTSKIEENYARYNSTQQSQQNEVSPENHYSGMSVKEQGSPLTGPAPNRAAASACCHQRTHVSLSST